MEGEKVRWVHMPQRKWTLTWGAVLFITVATTAFIGPYYAKAYSDLSDDQARATIDYNVSCVHREGTPTDHVPTTEKVEMCKLLKRRKEMIPLVDAARILYNRVALHTAMYVVHVCNVIADSVYMHLAGFAMVAVIAAVTWKQITGYLKRRKERREQPKKYSTV